MEKLKHKNNGVKLDMDKNDDLMEVDGINVSFY